MRRTDPGHEGELYVKTRLYSHVMPNRVMEGIVECTGRSQREIAQLVASTVGASAENFGEQYGDLIDPSAAAKIALDNLDRVIRAFNK